MHHTDPLFQESLEDYYLYGEGGVPLLFTENETNHERLFPGQRNHSRYVKDGINNYVVEGKQGEVNNDNSLFSAKLHMKLSRMGQRDS